ncbi:MAG: DnaJ domain-containing protein [Bacteroidaceae bacterium]|nr:DnaJ domain-containing protein [Bacteroidaceae bacterium]
MANFIDYYKILGVSKDVPQSEIKAAYRKRSKQFHPDLHPDDPKAKAKFQMLNEAYDVLNDPDKRAKYDKYGEQWNKVGQGFGGSDGGQGFGGNPFEGFDFDMNGGSFSDFFSQLFGGGQRRPGMGGGFESVFGGRRRTGQPSSDVQANVDIDMYQAVLGGELIIQAGGSKLRLKVKPGTQPGTKVRLKGRGNIGLNGQAGDLIITYNVVLPTSLTERQKHLLDEMRRC